MAWIERKILNECLEKCSYDHIWFSDAGFLIGTAGVALLSSDDAKSAYTHITAAVKRGGTSVMKTFTTLKENCEDVGADADDINRKRAEKKRAQEIADAKETLRRAAEEDAEKAAEEADAAAADEA